MRALLHQKVALVLVLICLGVATISAQARAQEEPEIRMLPPVAPHFETPPLVRLTGSLQPVSRKASEGFRTTFKLFIGRKEWLLQLEYVETWNDATRSWSVLNDFFPTELHLTGPEDFLGPLRQPEMTGKRITIAGRFSAADQVLAVTGAAEEANTPP